MQTQVIAHRGANKYAPENTLPAFQQAVALGADILEADMRQTSDGYIVLSHDDTINRVANLTGAGVTVEGRTLAQLQAYDFSYIARFGSAYAGTKILTLADFLAYAKSVNKEVHIEFKGSGMNHTAAINQVKAAGMLDMTLFCSFNMSDLTAAYAIEPTARLAYIYSSVPSGLAVDPAAYAEQYHLAAYYTDMNVMNFDLMYRCREAGIAVYPWTLNAVTGINTCVAWNVDGICTDDIELVQSLLPSP